MHSSNHRLFVYGSLLSGFNQPAFEYIRRYFTFLGQANVKGILYDMGTYPVAVPATDEQYIVGELYQLNNEEEYVWAFNQLDAYEGIHTDDTEPSFYRRELAEIYINAEVVTAWLYWFKGEITEKPVLPSGDVTEYFLQNKAL